MRFEKAGGEWQMAQPLAARADFSAVEGLVSRLTTLQMKSIAAPEAADLAQYGLDKPAATRGDWHRARRRPRSPSASRPARVRVYARDPSKPMVVTIESALLDELKKAPADYRQKDLFDARAFNATRVELVRLRLQFRFIRASKQLGRQFLSAWPHCARIPGDRSICRWPLPAASSRCAATTEKFQRPFPTRKGRLLAPPQGAGGRMPMASRKPNEEPCQVPSGRERQAERSKR